MEALTVMGIWLILGLQWLQAGNRSAYQGLHAVCWSPVSILRS